MGHIGNIAHPDVQALIEKAAAACPSGGKAFGIVGPNPEMVRRFIDYGYDFAAIGSDIAMMTGRASDWLGDLRDEKEQAPTPAAAY